MISKSISGRKAHPVVLPLVLAVGLLAWPGPAGSQESASAGRTQPGAVFVCSAVDAGKPLGRAAVFSSAQETLYCYSEFAQVAASEQITHLWFFRDSEVAQFRLVIQPPRWSSYSSLKIPAASTGPWRVDVVGRDGKLYGTARFSIVE